MNIENLKEGMVIKNYRRLCKVLNWKVTGGDSKKSQLKELDRFCNYEKQGNKFIIKEIYLEPLEKKDGRNILKIDDKRKLTKQYEELNIEQSEYDNIGVYYILKDNDIYIGSTIQGYKTRFQKHYYGCDESMPHTYEMLQDGATFNILYNMTGIDDEPLIRMVENEFIQYFINYTDYNVINKKENAWSYTEKQDITKPKKEKPKKNNKQKYKTLKVKIPENKYEEAMQLLIDNGLLESENPSNNFIDSIVQLNNFDMNNIPF